MAKIWIAAGRLCLLILICCAVFQAMFLAMAYVAEMYTDPPACQVRYAFPMPFASCGGFNFGPQIDYALALPGAVLAFPFILPNLIRDTGSTMQPFVIVPTLIHLIGWSYLAYAVVRRWRKRP